MTTSAGDAYRNSFSHWLRTGRWLRPHGFDGRELKFNPYHDPFNGQFTFAPGGPRSLSRILVADRQGRRSWVERTPEVAPKLAEPPVGVSEPEVSAERPFSGVLFAQRGRVPGMPRGGNTRAFDDPMTLEQAFPGLSSAPAGAIVAAAESFLDIKGPARAATAKLASAWSEQLIADIREVDPNFRFASLGEPQSLQGQINQLNKLRMDRALILFRVKGEVAPLQVEVLRFIQSRVDEAYEEGLRLLAVGRLRVRLSREEALGNHVDRQVRFDLRRHFEASGIDAAGKGPIRVNRREPDSSPSDQFYRQPDSRIDRLAIDVTLTPKSLKTPQVRGFFIQISSPATSQLSHRAD